MSGTAEEIAAALLDADALLVRPEAPFRLTSGLRAPFYINCRLILSRPRARALAAAALAATVPMPATTAVAGGVTAGVPFATLVAARLRLPLVYVRAEAKTHGTAGRIEGGAVAGERVHLIEDLISTAGSILAFTRTLREGGRRGGWSECVVLASGRVGASRAGGGRPPVHRRLRSRHAASGGARRRAHRRGRRSARSGPSSPIPRAGPLPTIPRASPPLADSRQAATAARRSCGALAEASAAGRAAVSDKVQKSMARPLRSQSP